MTVTQANKNIEMFGISDPDEFILCLRMRHGKSSKDSIVISMLSDVQEHLNRDYSVEEIRQTLNLIKFVISEF